MKKCLCIIFIKNILFVLLGAFASEITGGYPREVLMIWGLSLDNCILIYYAEYMGEIIEKKDDHAILIKNILLVSLGVLIDELTGEYPLVVLLSWGFISDICILVYYAEAVEEIIKKDSHEINPEKNN